MDRNRIDHTDYDALRGYAGRGAVSDGGVADPADEEPSARRGPDGGGGRLGRIVLGVAYAVQWLRSRWSSKHEGRS